MADIKDMLDEKRKMVDQKATQYRTTRDEWNGRTKEHTVIRNELNAEVRELIQNVRQQREIREQMNELVREKKSIRAEANTKVKQAKSMLDSERNEKDSEPASQIVVDVVVRERSQFTLFAEICKDSSVNSNKADTLVRTKRRSWSA